MAERSGNEVKYFCVSVLSQTQYSEEQISEYKGITDVREDAVFKLIMEEIMRSHTELVALLQCQA